MRRYEYETNGQDTTTPGPGAGHTGASVKQRTFTSGGPGKRRAWLIRPGAVALAVVAGVIWLGLAMTAGSGPLRVIPLRTPPPASLVVVDAPAGRALVVGGTADGGLSLIDTPSGALVQTIPLAGRVLLPLVAVARRSGRAFVVTRPPWPATSGIAPVVMDVVDVYTGHILRTVPLPNPGPLAVDERSGHVFVASAGSPGRVSVLGAASGMLVQRIPVGAAFYSAVAVDEQTEHVFVANARSNTVSVLDARTGMVVRTAPVAPGPSAIAVDQRTGRAFVASEEGGAISLLDTRTGLVLRTIPLVFPLALAVDGQAGRVVVTSAGTPAGTPATVSLLDATSGAVLHTLAVGGSPSAVAVDARRNRAFIIGTQWRRALFVLLHHVVPFGLSWLGENNDDALTVVDTRSGALLRTLHLRGYSVAVDDQAGHVFVTNPADNTVSMLDATH